MSAMKSAYNCATVNLHRHGMLSQRRGRRTCGRMDVHVRVAREARTRKSCTPFEPVFLYTVRPAEKLYTVEAGAEKLYTVRHRAAAGHRPIQAGKLDAV